MLRDVKGPRRISVYLRVSECCWMLLDVVGSSEIMRASFCYCTPARGGHSSSRLLWL